MVNIANLFNTLEAILGSYPFLLLVFTCFFILKAYIITCLVGFSLTAPKTNRALFFLICVLLASMTDNCAWILKLVRTLFLPAIDFRIYTLCIRLAWAFLAVQYQALALFIESLVEQKFTLKKYHLPFLIISSCFFLFFTGLGIVNFNCLKSVDRPQIEFLMQKIAILYVLFPLILTAVFITIRKLDDKRLPRILTKQIKILIISFLAPYWLSDFLQIYPFHFSYTWITNSYTFVSISNILLIYTVYYCSRKVMGLRFLNLKGHVAQPSIDFNFMETFKTTLEQFSRVTSEQELNHITQGFFKESFGMPLNKTNLYIRKIHAKKEHPNPFLDDSNQIVTLVEGFIGAHDQLMYQAIKKHKILIYDELTFSNFYERQDERSMLIAFLDSINADLFLPIYQKERLTGYIITDRLARLNIFYGDVERDEMLVFASYLNNIINLLENRNLDTLIAQEKSLNEELYRKHQEINQYKESIRSFLRNSTQKSTGIIFYKNRHFIFGNQVAKEMIRININMQEGHPLTKALKRVAQQVEAYKAPQTQFAKDTQGNTLILSGVPNLESNNVIITVSYPEISDIIKKQIDMLKDPSERDYLLYLETTKSGKLINQLIPSCGETFLNFKIELLKISLSKKAIVLNMPDQDLMPTVELLHHISLRERLHTLDLHSPSQNFDIAMKLFGINPIFGLTNQERPLLEKLNNTGTLFIKNIDFIDLETQKYLAEFIRYGVYRTFKSEQKESSNVRIICSTSKNLQHLVQEGLFAQELFNELKQTTLVMPSLTTLPEKELNNLADGFTEQAVRTQTFKNLLTLTNKDKSKLAQKRPASLQELKTKVQHILMHKSKQNDLYQETQFESVYEMNDPELDTIKNLGKYALKDQKAMQLLWDKFQNQNKIALFLGVNRSSVNRRCKMYNLK